MFSETSATHTEHGVLCKQLFVSHSGAGMLNSPPLVSDNFLNEAHYVFIDFSYSFSEVNTPKVLLLLSALRSTQPFSPRYLRYVSIHRAAGFYQLLPKRRQTAEHLRELNGFQLAKQIPPLTLTLSHSASESLAGHYRQLEFNKPNMLTVLIEKEEGRRGGSASLSLSLSPSVVIYFLLL